MNVLLLGSRGSGKTTVGTRLAAMLCQTFIDLDDVVLARIGEQSVTEAWSRHSEAAWRAVEARALGDALQFDNQVIALGGGTAMIHEARRAIRAAQREGRATVVYLKCAPAVLAERLERQPGDRPSLTGRGTVEEVESVLTRREPVYLELSDIRLDAEADPEAVAAAIAKKMQQAGTATKQG